MSLIISKKIFYIFLSLVCFSNNDIIAFQSIVTQIVGFSINNLKLYLSRRKHISYLASLNQATPRSYKCLHMSRMDCAWTNDEIIRALSENLFAELFGFCKISLFSDCTTQKMKFSIKDFFSKCDEIRSFLQIWSHLLNKFLIENFIFCGVLIKQLVKFQIWQWCV